MGLDTVELVMKVEETFDLEIPDVVAAKLATVGQLHSYLVERINQRSDLPVDPAATFVRLRDIICRQLKVKPDAVTPDARFVEDLRAD
jgi:acyl carrier protein